MKIDDLIHRLDLEFTFKEVPRNPNYESLMAKHYEITIHKVDRVKPNKFVTSSFSCFYSRSFKRKGNPTLEEILIALAVDSLAVEESEMDLEDPKKVAAFEAMKSNAEKLKKFLGPVLYFQLLDSVK